MSSKVCVPQWFAFSAAVLILFATTMLGLCLALECRYCYQNAQESSSRSDVEPPATKPFDDATAYRGRRPPQTLYPPRFGTATQLLQPPPCEDSTSELIEDGDLEPV